MARGTGCVQPTARWLYDAYGAHGEDEHDFIEDARDLIAYLEAHGVKVRKERSGRPRKR